MSFKTTVHNLLQDSIENLFTFITFVFTYITPITKTISSQVFYLNGIVVGDQSGDIRVKDDRYYALISSKMATGFYEAYIEGYFETDDIQLLLTKILGSNTILVEKFTPYRLLKYLVHRFFDVLNVENYTENVNEHYDLSHQIVQDCFGSVDHYSTMLLNDAKQIENATVDEIDSILQTGTFKMRDKIAKKLRLEPGMKVLDIGCGFGGLAKHLAEHYDVHVTGVTISSDMAARGRELCKDLDVTIEKMDYRCVIGKFDRIVSIEMFEHVGENHHREYFEKVNQLLKDDGLFVFQTTAINHRYYPSYTPMFEKCLQMYVYFPTPREIVTQSEHLLVVENMDSLSYYFGLTFTAIVKKMVDKKEWLVEKYSEKVYRQWLFYMGMAAAAGLTKTDRVYQITFSKHGVKNTYEYKP